MKQMDEFINIAARVSTMRENSRTESPLVMDICKAYEAAKAPRTISREEFEKYKWYIENYGPSDALATLGITVGY